MGQFESTIMCDTHSDWIPLTIHPHSKCESLPSLLQV
jgi:hypothetical protein